MKKELISIVVPVFNEELNLERFYSEMDQATKNSDYDIELIFVNDGSRDASFSVLKNLAAKDSRTSVINFSRNFGSYAAIEAGLTKACGDAMMCISADLQDPPAIINQFVPLWRKGYEVVWGTRSGRDDPFFKSLWASMFYWFVRKAAFKDFPRDGMDIGLFDKKVIAHYLKIQDRNSIPFFTIYSLGFKQARVPYRRMERHAGESGWPFWKRVKCAIDVAVSFSYVPIRLMTTFGIIFSIAAFLYAAYIIVLRLNGQHQTDGWSSLAVLILFTGGIQMVFMGVLSEYIWRTSDKVRNRPVYIVMDEINGDPQKIKRN